MDKMKKYDLILLKNENPYKQYNLEKNMHGIVLENNFDTLNVLFFNPKNQGDYIIVTISVYDVMICNEKLPEHMIYELNSNLELLKSNAKNKFEPLKIKAYDMVELLVEDSKYAKYGVHKGDRGCVMEDKAVQNYIEVDFSGIDENGEFYGDCISVKIDDLKVIR